MEIHQQTLKKNERGAKKKKKGKVDGSATQTSQSETNIPLSTGRKRRKGLKTQ